MRNAYSGVLALTAMRLLMEQQGEQQEEGIQEEAPRKIRHEWDSVSLSKQERRGKTYEEIQELRKAKYEAMRRHYESSRCIYSREEHF